ncbi:MAG: DUF3300 domain-containing protein [Thermodesulfobacteriota bacterium]
MKAATIFHLLLGLLIISFYSLPSQSLGQDNSYLEPSEKFSREELAQMLAPIALYPDALLSQVLMASTYPIEVIEADRWRGKEPELKGEALDEALLAKEWAPSVKAISHFPSILALMSERITETTNLGNAFLAQEDEVMDMVQELRAKAEAQGNLTTTSEQKVIVEKETIIIESADPRVIYVPYYDSFHIYGPWWYPAYPPYYWGPPGVRVGTGISYWPRFYFGFAFGAWSYFDWHRHYIYIDIHKRPRFVRHNRWISRPGRWHHAPRHRRGVAYREKSTARKYGQYPRRSRGYRRDTRGFPEHRGRDRNRLKRDVDHSRIERDRQHRQRVDRDKQRREQQERQGKARQRTQRRDTQIREQAERNRQERARPERVRQQRERSDRTRQIDERAKRGRQERQRVERERQRRPRADQERRGRQRVERGKQIRQQAERNRQERARPERIRQERQRVERERQKRPRVDQERRGRQRVERQQQQRRRDNIFNRVEDGRKVRKSRERGRVSRQGREQGRRDGSRGRGRRDGRGRNRR